MFTQKKIQKSYVAGIKGCQDFSFIDWHGKVSAVIFLSGCNMRCGYCHNHAVVENQESFHDIPYEGILKKLESMKGWVDGVVISGGEPTLSPCLNEILGDIKERGFQTKLDTNGLRPEVLADVLSKDLVDCVAMDVKSPFCPFSYKKVAGVSVDLKKVRESLRILMEGTVEYHVRVTLGPALSVDDYKRLIVELDGVKHIILQRFRPGDIMTPALNDMKSLSDDDLKDLLLFAADYVEKVTVSKA